MTINPATLAPGDRVTLVFATVDAVFDTTGADSLGAILFFRAGEDAIALFRNDDGTLRDDEGRVVEVREART
jgi:hypothetical protein